MSKHVAEVVTYSLRKHDNADSLSVATIKGWECVVKTEDFKDEGPLAVYIPSDMVAAADHPILGFLEGKRIRPVRLRGVFSQGILLPLTRIVRTYNLKSLPHEGDDLSSLLQVKRYEPPIRMQDLLKTTKEYAEVARPEFLDKYSDIENIKNYMTTFQHGEPVVITEKIHGSNAIYGLINGKFYIASRNRVLRTEPTFIRTPIFKNKRKLNKWLQRTIFWKMFSKVKEIAVDDTVWHRVALQYSLEAKLRDLSARLDGSDLVLYGEVCPTQKLTYGFTAENVGFFGFDLRTRHSAGYLPQTMALELMKDVGIPTVPVLYTGPYDPQLLELRNGNSTVATHIREGIIIQPTLPRTDRKLGRAILKLKGEQFLLKDYE